MTRFLLASLLCLLLSPAPDDGAASIAAGGIVLMKREPRIVMAKEVLRIGKTVDVEYEFRNDSDETIKTEVAFPVPAYALEDTESLSGTQKPFSDFALWVDGRSTVAAMQERAIVGGRDITAALQGMQIDVGSFDRSSPATNKEHPRRIPQLNPAQRSRLLTLKAVSPDADATPLWRMERKYHWAQTFPAHGIVRIRHHYTPIFGNSNTYETPEYATLCPTPALTQTLKRQNDAIQGKDENGHAIGLSYVDFILTTANTWKTPIEDFTLIVERPAKSESDANYISFCWDGPVSKLDQRHFSAHLANFIPTKELRVGFLQ